MEEIRIDIDSVKVISKRLDNVIDEISDVCRNITKLSNSIDRDIFNRRQIEIVYFRTCSELKTLVNNMEQMSLVIKNGAEKYYRVDIYLQKLTVKKESGLIDKPKGNKAWITTKTIFSLGLGIFAVTVAVGEVVSAIGVLACATELIVIVGVALVIVVSVVCVIYAVNDVINDMVDLYNISKNDLDKVNHFNCLKEGMQTTGKYVLGTLDSDNQLVKDVSRAVFMGAACKILGLGGYVGSKLLFKELDKRSKEESEKLGQNLGGTLYYSGEIVTIISSIKSFATSGWRSIKPMGKIGNNTKGIANSVNSLSMYKRVQLDKVKSVQGIWNKSINGLKTLYKNIPNRPSEIKNVGVKAVNVISRTFIKPLKSKDMTNAVRRKDVVAICRHLIDYSKNTSKQIKQIKEIGTIMKIKELTKPISNVGKFIENISKISSKVREIKEIWQPDVGKAIVCKHLKPV